MTLRTRLILFVSALVAAIILIVSATAYFRMKAEISAGVEREIQAAVPGSGEALSRWAGQRSDALLVEHTVNDHYWGDGGDGSGKNRLGQLLMQVRDELRDADSA